MLRPKRWYKTTLSCAISSRSATSRCSSPDTSSSSSVDDADSSDSASGCGSQKSDVPTRYLDGQRRNMRRVHTHHAHDLVGLVYQLQLDGHLVDVVLVLLHR